jgi:hypothetical protein
MCEDAACDAATELATDARGALRRASWAVAVTLRNFETHNAADETLNR